MKELVKEWTTEELIEFLITYNRVYNQDEKMASVYRELYVHAYGEFSIRQPLMSLLF